MMSTKRRKFDLNPIKSVCSFTKQRLSFLLFDKTHSCPQKQVVHNCGQLVDNSHYLFTFPQLTALTHMPTLLHHRLHFS